MPGDGFDDDDLFGSLGADLPMPKTKKPISNHQPDQYSNV